MNLIYSCKTPSLKSNDCEHEIRSAAPGRLESPVDVQHRPTAENDVLTINARVSFGEYEGLSPLYSEYNVGNFFRRFSLGEIVDREKITADIENGVLTVTLPKKEAILPRRIELS